MLTPEDLEDAPELKQIERALTKVAKLTQTLAARSGHRLSFFSGKSGSIELISRDLPFIGISASEGGCIVSDFPGVPHGLWDGGDY